MVRCNFCRRDTWSCDLKRFSWFYSVARCIARLHRSFGSPFSDTCARVIIALIAVE